MDYIKTKLYRFNVLVFLVKIMTVEVILKKETNPMLSVYKEEG